MKLLGENKYTCNLLRANEAHRPNTVKEMYRKQILGEETDEKEVAEQCL